MIERTKEKIDNVIELWETRGYGINKIHKETGLDRETVRNILREFKKI